MPTLTPVDFDPFAGPPSGGVQTVPGQNGAPTRVIMDMGQPSEPKLVPVDHDPFAQTSPAYDQAADIVKGFGGGLVRGAANTIGFVTDTAPNFIADQLNWLDGKVRGETPEQTQARVASERAELPDWLKAAGENLSVSGIQRNIESVTGPAYVPHTRAGRFASTAAEFVPGAMVPLGGPLRAGKMAGDALAFGVVPGLASEGAGQVFEGGARWKALRVLPGPLQAALEAPQRCAAGPPQAWCAKLLRARHLNNSMPPNSYSSVPSRQGSQSAGPRPFKLSLMVGPALETCNTPSRAWAG